MKTFKVFVELPMVQREIEYSINCSSFATASRKGIELARKELGRKKVKEIFVRLVYLGPTEEPTS